MSKRVSRRRPSPTSGSRRQRSASGQSVRKNIASRSKQTRRPPVKRRGQQPERNLPLMIGAGVAGVGLLVFLILVIFGGGKLITAEEGTLSFSLQNEGVVIRDERLYKAEDYGKIEYIAQEGQVVSSGTSIADVYSYDYNAKDYEALKELQEKIMDYQQSSAQTGAINEDMETLDALILEKTEEIKKVVTGEADGNINVLEKELLTLMNERASQLRSSTKADDTLTGYYEEERAYLDRLEGYKRTIVSEGDGVISFYFDGKEVLLTPDNLDSLTVQNIRDIMQGKLNYVPEEAAERPFYRLVDRNQWYVIMITDKEVPEFEGDTAFKVAFSYGDDYSYQATISGHREDSGKHIYYLRFTQDVDKLLLARQVSFTVSSDFVGIKVPAAAIKKKGGETGVYQHVNGKKVFVPVEVLIEENKEAIIRSVDINAGLDAGSQIYS